MAQLKSDVKLLLTCLDALKSQQCEHCVETSKKLSWFLDYVKSVENNILSELQKLSSAPKSSLRLKDNISQTSPENVPDKSLREASKSQLGTFVDDSLLHQYDLPMRSDLTNDRFAREFCASCHVKEHTCMECSHGACKDCFSGLESRMFPKFPDMSSSQTFQRTLVEKQPILGNPSITSTQFSQIRQLPINGNCRETYLLGTVEKFNSLENIEENVSGRKGKNVKGKKAKKRKKPARRIRNHCPLENNTDKVSRTLAESLQDESENISWGFGRSVKESAEDCLTLHCESCVPSLPIPERKTRRKNVKKPPLLCSNERQEQLSSTKHDMCVGERVGVSVAEQKLVCWDFASEDSNHLHYSITRENHMAWVSPSRPLFENGLNQPRLRTEQKTFSLFFDSSDDSN